MESEHLVELFLACSLPERREEAESEMLRAANEDPFSYIISCIEIITAEKTDNIVRAITEINRVMNVKSLLQLKKFRNVFKSNEYSEVVESLQSIVRNALVNENEIIRNAGSLLLAELYGIYPESIIANVSEAIHSLSDDEVAIHFRVSIQKVMIEIINLPYSKELKKLDFAVEVYLKFIENAVLNLQAEFPLDESGLKLKDDSILLISMIVGWNNSLISLENITEIFSTYDEILKMFEPKLFQSTLDCLFSIFKSYYEEIDQTYDSIMTLVQSYVNVEEEMFSLDNEGPIELVLDFIRNIAEFEIHLQNPSHKHQNSLNILKSHTECLFNILFALICTINSEENSYIENAIQFNAALTLRKVLRSTQDINLFYAITEKINTLIDDSMNWVSVYIAALLIESLCDNYFSYSEMSMTISRFLAPGIIEKMFALLDYETERARFAIYEALGDIYNYYGYNFFRPSVTEICDLGPQKRNEIYLKPINLIINSTYKPTPDTPSNEILLYLNTLTCLNKINIIISFSDICLNEVINYCMGVAGFSHASGTIITTAYTVMALVISHISFDSDGRETGALLANQMLDSLFSTENIYHRQGICDVLSGIFRGRNSADGLVDYKYFIHRLIELIDHLEAAHDLFIEEVIYVLSKIINTSGNIYEPINELVDLVFNIAFREIENNNTELIRAGCCLISAVATVVLSEENIEDYEKLLTYTESPDILIEGKPYLIRAVTDLMRVLSKTCFGSLDFPKELYMRTVGLVSTGRIAASESEPELAQALVLECARLAGALGEANEVRFKYDQSIAREFLAETARLSSVLLCVEDPDEESVRVFVLMINLCANLHCEAIKRLSNKLRLGPNGKVLQLAKKFPSLRETVESVEARLLLLN